MPKAAIPGKRDVRKQVLLKPLEARLLEDAAHVEREDLATFFRKAAALRLEQGGLPKAANPILRSLRDEE